MPQKGGLRFRVCLAIISGIVRTMLCFISSFVHLIHIYIYLWEGGFQNSGYRFWGPCNQDDRILVSIFRFPYL